MWVSLKPRRHRLEMAAAAPRGADPCGSHGPGDSDLVHPRLPEPPLDPHPPAEPAGEDDSGRQDR